VTHCDTKVLAGQTGELQNDLTCQDATHAVDLFDGATLRFNGHTITGEFLPWPHDERQPGTVIECRGDCTIEGPGEIYGALGPGLFDVFGEGATAIRFGTGNKKVYVSVSDLTIRECGDAMLGENVLKRRPRARVALSDVSLVDNTGVGIAFVDTLDAVNVVADHNLLGLTARVLRGINLRTNANVYGGIAAARVVIVGLVAQGNSTGVTGKRITLSAAEVTGNFSTVWGVPIDIDATTRPRVTETTCTQSHRRRSRRWSSTWKICSDD
jgi:hypothetical protein